MKKLIFVFVFMFLAGPAFADYSSLKVIVSDGDTGIVLETFTITTTQVERLKKTKTITGLSVLAQFKRAFADMINFSKAINKQRWLENNPDYIDSVSSQ